MKKIILSIILQIVKISLLIFFSFWFFIGIVATMEQPNLTGIGLCFMLFILSILMIGKVWNIKFLNKNWLIIVAFFIVFICLFFDPYPNTDNN